MPDDADFAEAAAPLLVTLTAWRMLIHRAALRTGESVLVVGSGGGVNSMSIQVAKLAGAFVYAVASDEKEAVLSAGSFDSSGYVVGIAAGKQRGHVDDGDISAVGHAEQL